MSKMKDRQAVIILSRIRDCRMKKNCDMECDKCNSNYSDTELVEAISTSIDALLERDKNDD